MKFVTSKKKFTQEQQAIINEEAKKVVVVAGPGVGKTTLLIGKAEQIKCRELSTKFKQDSKNQPCILFLSFSNRAVKDVRAKLEENYPKGIIENHIEVKTIHAFAMKVALKWKGEEEEEGEVNDEYFWRQPKIEPVNEEDFNRFVKDELDSLKPGGQNTWALCKKLVAKFKGGEETLTKEEAKIYKQIEKKKKRRGIIRFEEQIKQCLHLMQEHPEVLREIGGQYRLLLVDEYQDLNPDQIELVTLLAENIEEVLIVGDDCQAIYGFQGSRLESIKEAEEKLGAKKMSLTHSFRLTKEIAKIVNIQRKQIKQVTDLQIKASKNGVKPYYAKCETPDEHDQQIIEIIKYLTKEKGLTDKDILILGRTKVNLSEIYRLLKKNDYEVNFGDDEALEWICNVSCGMLKIWKKNDKDEIEKLLGCLNIEDKVEHVQAVKKRKVAKDSPKYLKHLIKKLQDGKNSKNFESRMDIVLDVVKQECKKQDKIFIDAYVANIKALIGELRSTGKAIKKIEQYKTESKDGINLITIHAAKGLESRAVILIDLVDGYFPFRENLKEKTQLEEEKRLFYVATSRPTEYLFLLSSVYTDGGKGELECSLLTKSMLKHCCDSYAD